MGAEAVRNAMTDAGLAPDDVNGMLSYHANDSTTSLALAQDLGIRPDFYMDCSGGGSSTEALVGLACGAIEAGMCHTVAIFRSMNGYSEARMGGTPAAGRPAPRGRGGRPPWTTCPYGLSSPAQMFQFTFARHMHDYGTTSEQLAHGQGGAQPARVQQPEGLLQDPGDGRRRAELAVDRQARLPPARLLRGDRQRHLHHRHVRRPGPAPPAAARLHHVGGRAGQQAVPGHALSVLADHPAGRVLRASGSSSAMPASSRRTSS